MKATLKNWFKGDIERTYINNEETGESIGYVQVIWVRNSTSANVKSVSCVGFSEEDFKRNLPQFWNEETAMFKAGVAFNSLQAAASNKKSAKIEWK